LNKAKTGKSVYGPTRLPDIFNVYSSPVAANEKIYITSRDGVTVVLSAGAGPRLLAKNKLDDTFNASAAIVGQELFLRGEQSLYCISKKTQNKNSR
jgi:outer membrane protein assembly factor BamB